jgi:ribosomal protein S18 acetylase RimI-like enzyme
VATESVATDAESPAQTRNPVTSPEHLLDNAAWASLNGEHQHFAQGSGQARRYRPDVSPIMAIAPRSDDQVWHDLLALAGTGGQVILASDLPELAPGWQIEFQAAGVQMIGTDALTVDRAEEIVTLGAGDGPEMLSLVGRAQPGPFEARTYEMGTYLGIRRGDTLIAMAGERLHPPGWTEISAVCTDADFRGQGLATALVRAVAQNIRQRGEKPFLHAAQTNLNAIRLYQGLGFEIRREVQFTALRAPGEGAA